MRKPSGMVVTPRDAFEAFKKDAERYRWLRERPSFIGWDWWQPSVPQSVLITPEFMDSAIDEAMAAVIDRAENK